MLTTVLILLIAALAGFALLWWLLVSTEGIYLGRGVVVWLYDLYARRYDAIKQYDPFTEDAYLARPVLAALPAGAAPLVLDVATGTGRLPLALLEQPGFQGRIIALDLSRRMLRVAAEKLAPFSPRVTLLHDSAERLPFPADTFDLVTCLEALEFTPDPRAALDELVRVLRPGGLLVITNRQGRIARTMPGHTWSHDALEQILSGELGLLEVDIQVWTVDYRLVYALKPGTSPLTGPVPLEETWLCPACGAQTMAAVPEGWRCLTCETLIPVGPDGVIEAWSARRRAKASPPQSAQSAHR